MIKVTTTQGDVKEYADGVGAAFDGFGDLIIRDADDKPIAMIKRNKVAEWEKVS